MNVLIRILVAVVMITLTPARSGGQIGSAQATAYNGMEDPEARSFFYDCGNTTWTSSVYDPYRPHRLGSEDPANNARWGISRLEMPVPVVSPGQEVSFTINATAPPENRGGIGLGA